MNESERNMLGLLEKNDGDDDTIKMNNLFDENKNEENTGEDKNDIKMDDNDDDDDDDDADLKIDFHTKTIFCIDCFHDRWLVTGGEDKRALLYDLDIYDIEPTYCVTGHVDSVIFVRFNSSGIFLASGDLSGKIILTDICRLSNICEINECSRLDWLEWHNEADLLFAGAGNGIIWVFCVSHIGVSTVKVFAEGSGSSGSTGKVLGDGHRLLAAFSDGTIRLWSLLDQKSSAISIGILSSCVDAHKLFPLAAIGGRDGKCVIINTLKDKIVRLIEVSEVVGKNEKIGNFDLESDESKSNSVECVRFSDFKDKWLAIGTSGGILIIYDINTGCIRHKCDHGGQALIACRWFYTTDGNRCVITASLNGVIRIWDAKTGEKAFDGLISPQLALKVMTAFDKAINKALQCRAKNKTTFKADKLLTYRFCDNVWTFVMEGVEFRDATRAIDGVIDRVKIVACDGRASQQSNVH